MNWWVMSRTLDTCHHFNFDQQGRVWVMSRTHATCRRMNWCQRINRWFMSRTHETCWWVMSRTHELIRWHQLIRWHTYQLMSHITNSWDVLMSYVTNSWVDTLTSVDTRINWWVMSRTHETCHHINLWSYHEPIRHETTSTFTSTSTYGSMSRDVNLCHHINVWVMSRTHVRCHTSEQHAQQRAP